jgi:hypothetical protein
MSALPFHHRMITKLQGRDLNAFLGIELFLADDSVR